MVAPSSPPQTRSELEQATDSFTQLGYEVVFGPHHREVHGYLAGTDAHRAADLQWALRRAVAAAERVHHVVRSQILHVLLELQRGRELALLFITHDLSLAWQLCDRIAVMYLGRIVEQGDARDVIERPRHPYTQALVDAVPPRKQRTALVGELPDAANVPTGCRFHPRCPKRFEPCDREDPPLFPAGEPTHEAACLLLR